MNEKEKMINGLLYDAFADESLVQDRIKCYCYWKSLQNNKKNNQRR